MSHHSDGGRNFAGMPQPQNRHSDPRSYDDYFKAYSLAMFPGKQRENVSYGGKSKSIYSGRGIAVS